MIIQECIGQFYPKPLVSNNSIEVVASDGFVKAYPLEVLEAEDSLFALYKDGEAISEEDESGQLWFCAGAAFTANYWSKYLVKIVIR